MNCVLLLGKVEKAGATALFQPEGKGSNNIGVVVNPVRLSSLTDFGTPQFVADRLLQAEKKKVMQKCLNTLVLFGGIAICRPRAVLLFFN